MTSRHELGRPAWRSLSELTEVWASLAISVIWLAVLFDSVFGPNIVADGNNVGGGGTTVVPSGVVVALFAFLATRVVAKHGFDRNTKRDV